MVAELTAPTIVGGTTRFPLVGEPISLDLVNTRVRQHGSLVDLLHTPQQLHEWLLVQHRRLHWSGSATLAQSQSIRVLRNGITDLLNARRTGARPDARSLAAVNDALASSAPLRLGWAADGPYLSAPSGVAGFDDVVCRIATDAVALLTAPDGDLIRTCENPDCVLQFVARNPRRRWCSSDACGNRVRVARNYAKHRPAQPAERKAQP